MKPRLVIFSIALVLTFTLSTANAKELSGRVVSIVDGDTIILLAERSQIRLRLSDIDTPERGQPWYQKAKTALGSKIFGKDVLAIYTDKDRYGRPISRIFFDGKDINEEMVAQGHAWVFRKYSNDEGLIQLENQARIEGLGLWGLKDPVAPWLWRKGSRAPTIRSTMPASRDCGVKRFCSEMNSCEEALFHFSDCGVGTLDGDGDGRPCEKLCGHR